MQIYKKSRTYENAFFGCNVAGYVRDSSGVPLYFGGTRVPHIFGINSKPDPACGRQAAGARPSLFLDINFINRYYFLTLYIVIRCFLNNKQKNHFLNF
jgi:hypothetical protein